MPGATDWAPTPDWYRKRGFPDLMRVSRVNPIDEETFDDELQGR